jgi:heat shock protein HslJ
MFLKNYILFIFFSLLFCACVPTNKVLKSLNGEWLVTSIDNNEIKTTQIPTIKFNINSNQISGSDGCNNYRGSIEKIDKDAIQFSRISKTKKGCVNKMEIPQKFSKAVRNARSFSVNKNIIFMYNEDKTEILRATKN